MMHLLTKTSSARAIATKVVLGAGTLALLTCAVPTTASAQSRYYEPAYRGDQCVRQDRDVRYRTDYRTDYYVRERPRYVVREEPRYVVREEPRYVVREEYVPARPYYRRDHRAAKTAAVIGSSAVVGAGIGAAAGGGKGALIGAAIGAGAGAIINEVTRDHHHRYYR